MVSRCAISILILSALGVPWALEQPSSSVLEFHPAMQFIAKKFSMHKVWIWLGSYGHSCPKPTYVYSNCPHILKELYLPLLEKEWSAQMVNRYVDSQGKARVCGADDLKQSQHYPVMFGRTAAAGEIKQCRTNYPVMF
ncbi:unnamed protein product [Durusdinium trenchii]|uniref:Uncharacterized protein n=2 Tax=Durusdinium trenchii TaxID=1381693 RepID=A0ABP0LRV0_9DINO